MKLLTDDMLRLRTHNLHYNLLYVHEHILCCTKRSWQNANVHIFPIVKERAFTNNTYLQFYNIGGDDFC